MWKVKRMNTARIVVLTIAIGAGGIAATLASGPISRFAVPAAPIAQLQTSQAQTSQQQTWPAMTANNNFIDPRGEGLRAVLYGVASRQAMQT
jgi:pilus assembly protein CpaB